MAKYPDDPDDYEPLAVIPIEEVIAQIESAQTTGLSAQARANHVKAQYAQLRDDIVYRIENSALFDTAVPHTQRFELALLAWNPESEQAEHLADELEQAFHQAREHAETLGYNHLPHTARPTARRAAKAAEIALTSTNQAEATTARHQTAHLLADLALYWLPVVDENTPTLIGKPKMIDPAP